MSKSSILVHAFRWIDPNLEASVPNDNVRTEAWFVIVHTASGEPKISEALENLLREDDPSGFDFAGPCCALVGSSLFVIGEKDGRRSPRQKKENPWSAANQIHRLDVQNLSQGWKQCNPLPFHCVGIKPYVVGKFIYLFPSFNGGYFEPIRPDHHHRRQQKIPWGLLYDTVEQKCYTIEPPSGLYLTRACDRTLNRWFFDCIKCEPGAECTEDDPYLFYTVFVAKRGESAVNSDDGDLAAAFSEDDDDDDDCYHDDPAPRAPPPFCVAALDGPDPRLVVNIPISYWSRKQLNLHNPVKNEWEPYFDDDMSDQSLCPDPEHHALLNGILYSCYISDDSPEICLSGFDISKGQGARCLFRIDMEKPKNLKLRCGSISLVPIADFQLCLLWVKANRVRSKKSVLCYTRIVVSVDPSPATATVVEDKFLEIRANGLLSCLPY